MEKLILVINAGSSSIKFQLFEVPSTPSSGHPTKLYKGQIDAIYLDPVFTAKDATDTQIAAEKLPVEQVGNHDRSLHYILDWLKDKTHGRKISVIGHRVVHGGTQFSEPVRITEQIISDLENLIPLAPLHQPHNITPMRVLNRVLPGTLQVACFDTAFHTTQPELQQLVPLPYLFAQKEGIRRYGFHGLSYSYIASLLPQLLPSHAIDKVIICHLGNGSSMSALQAGKSYATTMAFTAVEGLPMGTRTGTLDPGILLYCLNHLKMDAKQIEDLIYKQSGLLGISGVSSDMRELHLSTDPRAKMAIDFFCMRIAREAASLAAALQGLDTLIFTAGIGENDPIVRENICAQLAWLDLYLDSTLNAQRLDGPRRISTPKSKIAVWIIPTNEELVIAQAALKAMA